jgi:prepilin-type N-terminal cleavage/methylation domain-containing protein
MTDAKRLPRRDDCAGVTLVELMVVLVLLGTGVLALAAVQTRSNRVVFETGQDTRALSIGQAQIEAARTAGFAGAVADSGRVDVFDWRTEVSEVEPGLHQVDVTVSWLENGGLRSLRLNTLVAER